jgi:hypothetical protein
MAEKTFVLEHTKVIDTRTISLNVPAPLNHQFLVEMRLSDLQPPEGLEMIDCRVLVPFDANPLLPALQKAALHRVRELISEEIRRLAQISNQ